MDEAVRLEELDLDAAALLARVVEGCAIAWRSLIAQYEETVRRSIWSFRFDAATTDDVIQSVWLKLYEHAGSINDPACLGAWLRTTARRSAIAVTRQRARSVPVAEFHGDVLAHWEDPDLTLPRERAALRAALGRLNPRSQQLLGLLFGERDLTYRQVADALGRPAGSVGPSRSRALDELRSEYRSELSRLTTLRSTM